MVIFVNFLVGNAMKLYEKIMSVILIMLFLIMTTASAYSTNIELTDPAARLKDLSGLPCSYCHVKGHGSRLDYTGLLTKNDKNYRGFITNSRINDSLDVDEIKREKPRKCPRNRESFDGR